MSYLREQSATFTILGCEPVTKFTHMFFRFPKKHRENHRFNGMNMIERDDNTNTQQSPCLF